jgi:hypothetical protein
MSHTTVIKTVPIRSVSALRETVKALQAQGIKIEMKENAVPRMYYPDQLRTQLKRSKSEADIVLHLSDSKYDVALLAKADGTYDIAYDTWNGYVSNVLGNKQSGLGKLLQEYSIQATLEAGAAAGYTLYNIATNEDGSRVVEFAVQ